MGYFNNQKEFSEFYKLSTDPNTDMSVKDYAKYTDKLFGKGWPKGMPPHIIHALEKSKNEKQAWSYIQKFEQNNENKQSMKKELKEKLQQIIREEYESVMREDSELQKAYDKFFDKMLSIYNVDSPDDLDDNKKKDFFNNIETYWDEGNGAQNGWEEKVKGVSESTEVPIPSVDPPPMEHLSLKDILTQIGEEFETEVELEEGCDDEKAMDGTCECEDCGCGESDKPEITEKKGKDLVATVGVAIDYWDEDLIEDMATEDGVEVNKEFWKELNKDAGKIEQNIVKYLLDKHGNTRLEGHNDEGVQGTYFLYDPDLLEDIEDAMDIQEPWRTSSGTLTDYIDFNKLYKGTSDFSQYLDITVYFFGELKVEDEFKNE